MSLLPIDPAAPPAERRPAMSLADVRRMLEGVVPPAMCTVGPDGMPHVNYLSLGEYVDAEHIALSYQFFNQTRRNVLATGRASLSLDDPFTGAGVVMQLSYVRTDTQGPVFERLRARLAGVASHTGMENIFHLRGADVWRVLELRRVPGRRELPGPQPRCDMTAAVRVLSERMADCDELDDLLDTVLTGLRNLLQIEHAMIWMVDAPRTAMVLLASIGYDRTGLGAELALGQGLAGIAALEGVPIRVGHMVQMKTYARAARLRAQALGLERVLHDEIPLPGLPNPRSQLAVPLRARGRVLGVLFAESDHDQFFSYDDEDALALVCGQLAGAITLLQRTEPAEPARAIASASACAGDRGPPLRVRHYTQDDTVFLGDDYLVKGVAGAVFWRLAREHAATGRVEFTNRELRLAAAELRLPDVQDNLEARLLLLQRRLAERDRDVRLERTGRGRFRLCLQRPLELVEAV